MQKSSTFLTLVALILATMFWGANFNVGKLALDGMHPLGIAAWRFAIAGILMMGILCAREGVNGKSIKRNILVYIVMGAVGVFGFNTLFFYGLRLTSPINGSLIMALNPALTVVLSALVLRERITLRQIAGLTLSAIGVLVVISDASLTALLKLNFSAGDLLILGGNFCWAAYSVIGKRFLKGSSAMQTTALSMAVGAFMIIVLALLQAGPTTFIIPSASIGACVLFMAVFGSVLAYLWWNKAIAQLGSARTAVFFDLVPISTMLISIAFGQVVSGVQLGGSVLVIVGVACSSGISFTKKPLVPAAIG